MVECALVVMLLSAMGEPPAVPNRLSYRPWQHGESLPNSRLPAEDATQPLLPGPAHARRRFELGAGLGGFPGHCLADRPGCAGHSAFARFGWRWVPRFSWSVQFERTSIAQHGIVALLVGARIFTFDTGRVDPYLELGLGIEHWDRIAGINLAGELGAGLNVYVLEYLKLGPVLKLRHGEHWVGTCNRRYRDCHAWSAVGERWLTAGLSMELPLGAPH